MKHPELVCRQSTTYLISSNQCIRNSKHRGLTRPSISANQIEKTMVRCGPMDNDLHILGSTTTGEIENHSIKTSLMPHSSSSIHISPYPNSQPGGQHEHLVSLNLSFKVPEATSIVKSETTDCPAANTVNEVTVNQTEIQPINSTVKNENPFNMQYFSKEHGKLKLIYDTCKALFTNFFLI